MVLRYDGRTVAVEDVRIGDLLMGPDSVPRRVLSVDTGIGPMRQIVPIKGEPWGCNDVHVLTLVSTDTGEVRDMPVNEWESMKPWRRDRWKLFIPESIDFPDAEEVLPIDPYFLGVWIGDRTKELLENGQLRTVSVTKPDLEVFLACEETAITHGVRVRSNDRSPNNPTHNLSHPNGGKRKVNQLLESMRRLWPNGGYNGSIPKQYLLSTRSNRLQLLAGLLDSDGNLLGGCFDITQKRRQTADDIAFLARSLGFRVTERDNLYEGTERRSVPTGRTTTYRRLRILGLTSTIPTRIARKQAAPRRKGTDVRRTGFTVKHLADGEFFGFTLDGDGRFLLGDFTVTHNTATMHRIINRTLQPYGPTFNPATSAETKFATIRNLSWSNTFVSAFDEYRTAEAGSDFMRLLRTGFSGGVEGRGSRDQSMRGYDLCGAVEVTGEQRADVDAAMGDRLVMVGLDKNRIDAKETPPALIALEATEERWRVATDILQWRMRLDGATVRRWWDASKADALEALARMSVQVPPRTRDACAEVAFRLRTWNEWLGHRAEQRGTAGEGMACVPRPPLDAVLRRMLETTSGLEIPEDRTSGTVISLAGKSLVVRALESITPYAVQGVFEEKKGYRLTVRNGRLMLVVYPGAIALTLAKEARSRGRNDPTNGEEALRAAGREEFSKEKDAGWLVDPSFPYRMGSTDEVGEDDAKTKRLRNWLIDVELAHERAGLELDWPGTPATWGGDRRANVTSLPTWKRMGTTVDGA